MYSILSNSLARNRTRSSPIISPKIIRSISFRGRTINSTNLCCVNTVRKRLPECQKSTCKNTKPQNSCYRICSALMCQNFSRGNILQHNNKQKQNSQSSNINQQLKQYKVFKTNQYQKSGTMKKKQYQIKYTVYWVFALGYQINTSQRTRSYQRKNQIHSNKKILIKKYEKKFMSQKGFEPITFELKARCSTIELQTHKK